MVSNGASHKVGATLAHPTVSPKKSATIDAAFARRPEEPVVFVIDDDVSVRESLDSLFKDVCLQAELFGSVSEFLASRLPDAGSCLVLDVRLRGMSGRNHSASRTCWTQSRPRSRVIAYVGKTRRGRPRCAPCLRL